jgi:CheY-like chemotaxis protein
MTRGLSDIVLIADSDVQRAERMAAACAERSIHVEVASHGARALEIALAELPVAIVAQLDLPLIEGTRLAEILRANPRTRAIGILFISDERQPAPGTTTAGRVIPGSSDPDTIVHFVEALLLKRRPRRKGEPAAEPLGGIEGELAQLALAELLELFHVNRKTGRILLERGPVRRREAGELVLREGEVVHAATGRVEGEKALYRLFGWDRGRFRFIPDETEAPRTVERPTRALLREGRRQAAEWDRLIEELPPQHTRVSLVVSRGELPNVLHPLTQEVLLVLEMTDRVEEVLDRCGFPDYQVLRTLTTLLRRGLIELRHDGGDEAPRVGPAVLAPAFTTRLREHIERQRRGLDAKVLVIASAAEAGHALSALIGRLPGADPPPRAVGARAIEALGRLVVEEDAAIEWITAPGSRRFSAVWPLAAHGALAGVFVHAGPPDAAVEALRPALDGMRALPRVRTLHAVLADKPSEASPSAAVCERLSLFDERSVVEIPLGAPERADEALRELLRRVLA